MRTKLLLATVCSMALAAPVAAEGIALDELFDVLDLSRSGNGGSNDRGLELDGLAELTLGNTTILSSPDRRPLVTANVLDERAGRDADILNLVLGNHDHADDNTTSDRTIRLTDLDRLVDNLTGNGSDGLLGNGGNGTDGLDLGGLADVRLLGENLITSGDQDPILTADLLDLDNDDRITVADLGLGTSRNGGSGNDVTDDLARALGDLVGGVSEDSRDRSRGLLRLDGLAEVSLGDATIISSPDRRPLVSANVLDRSNDAGNNIASVNVSADNDRSDNGNTASDNDRGLGGAVSRLTGGLLR